MAAIKQGGLKGQGMGEGILKESVPEAHTDYNSCNNRGIRFYHFYICYIYIFIYFLQNNKKCIKNSNENYKIALCGLSSLLIFQTFIHIGEHQSITNYWYDSTFFKLRILLIGSSILAGVILNFTKIDLKMNKDNKNIIIATGGTGGHTFPAISLAKDLKKMDIDLF